MIQRSHHARCSEFSYDPFVMAGVLTTPVRAPPRVLPRTEAHHLSRYVAILALPR